MPHGAHSPAIVPEKSQWSEATDWGRGERNFFFWMILCSGRVCGISWGDRLLVSVFHRPRCLEESAAGDLSMGQGENNLVRLPWAFHAPAVGHF